MANHLNDLTGKTFGMLTVLYRNGSTSSGRALWRCSCECGKLADIGSYVLSRGITKSCGCIYNPYNTETHGLSRHPLYARWSKIKARLYNPKHRFYPFYGGRGVTMCDEWKNDFKAFYDWAIKNGWQKNLEIDKDIIPKKLGVPATIYSPEMCSIVTGRVNKQYKSNRRELEYKGMVKSLSEWSEFLGIGIGVIKYRLKSKKFLTTSDIFETQVNNTRK